MARRRDYDDDYDDEEEEIEYVLFQGAMNDAPVDLEENRRLTHAGLMPAKELVTDALMRRANRVRINRKVRELRLFCISMAWRFPADGCPNSKPTPSHRW